MRQADERDALELWCQVAPQGEFKRVNKEGGEYTQLLDAEAFRRLIEDFEEAGRDVLVDFEHFSATTEDSRAAGWMKALRVNGGVLEARIRFTPEGAEEVRDYVRRYLSPVWALGADNRPLRLVSAGLTNVPYFNHLRPVLNKGGGADTQEQAGGLHHNLTRGTAVKELAILFGLSEDASEADILAAVKKYKEEQDGKAVTAEAEQAAVENCAKIGDKAAFIKAFCANKEVAMATLNAAKAPVCNKASAKAPSFAAGGGVKALNRADFNAALGALPPGKRQAYYDENSGFVEE